MADDSAEGVSDNAVGREELRRAFSTFDRNGDGLISKQEMRESFDNLRLCVGEEELACTIRTVDVNGDGYVDFDELVTLYESMIGKPDREEEGDTNADHEDADLAEAFGVFDENGDGLITVEELQSVHTVLNKVLIKSAKKVTEPPQRKTLFRTVCKVQEKCCQMIIDSGSTDNLVSTEVVEKLKLKTRRHPTSYKVSWLQKGHQLLVSEQCELEFQVGKYKDKVVCDVMPMDVCHILLGRPWQYDRAAMHDGKKNTYKFEKDGVNHTLLPLPEEGGPGQKADPKTLLLGGKEYLKQIKEGEVSYAVICKPRVIMTSTKVSDLTIEIQEMLESYYDIIVDDLTNELLPIRRISHHIDLIPGASLPNNAAYRMTPAENEEIKKQVHKKKRRREYFQYLVKWKGQPITEATWVTEDVLQKLGKSVDQQKLGKSVDQLMDRSP